jgi:hypothetical protein
MIVWMDFVLDERFGPLLKGAAEASGEGVAAVMEDSDGQHIQETRQGRQPARMVGNNLLESNQGQDRRDADAMSLATTLAVGAGGAA